MPINLLFHDTRLEGLTPAATSGTLTFEVNASTPLSSFFQICRSKAELLGGIEDLSIMCHGIEHSVYGPGYGLAFCAEGISSNTVGDPPNSMGAGGSGFGLLRGLVRRITLYVCGSAAHAGQAIITDTGETLDGDGFAMCRQIAINAHATVVASSELQAYRGSFMAVHTFGSPDDLLGLYCVYDEHEEMSELDFGPWEGRVFTFDENGIVIDETVYPSAWRDGQGVLHDPRELSAPPSSEPAVEESWFCRD